MSGVSSEPPKKSPLSPEPRALHRYQVVEEIARGGMGVVYRVVDRVTGTECALKRSLSLGSSRAAALAASFEREYQVLSSLSHPRIIRVFDFGIDAEGPYYTMELLRGGELSAPAPWRQVCFSLRDIATSLSLLHARRLLHRDLSPRNVKHTDGGHCKLLDFGALADFGVPTNIVGTPPLVPPEAVRGDMLDQRADLYALGALGYWLLTGQHAFPARHLDDLDVLWERAPRAPSQLIEGIPRALDVLLLSLLSKNPLARPSSAAEVIAKLNTVADLPVEEERERQRLAASFLIVPPFVGRKPQLSLFADALASTCVGRGAALRIEASRGAGGSRLLEELGLRAQVAGATVLRADASMHPTHLGTLRALTLRLLDALPDIALASARSGAYAVAFASLGRDVEQRIGVTPSRPLRPSLPGETSQRGLDDWFLSVSRHKPLVLEVDGLSHCDDASLGFCLELAQRAASAPVLLVVAESVSGEPHVAKGLSLLREQCTTVPLENLSPDETRALTSSLFDGAPHVERFADWLHGRTAGSPLHIVEISRQLVSQDVVRHDMGMWVLPAALPDVELPEALEDTLAIRLRTLGPRALSLAQSLCLQRVAPSLALCQILVEEDEATSPDGSAARLSELLDELAKADVVVREQSGYRFSSSALRDALLANMSQSARERSHHRLGLAFAKLAKPGDLALRLEAGWHFMQGGDALRGADMVASVVSNGWAVRQLGVNSYPLGHVTAAALTHYNRHRRSAYERLPLLAALAEAGYFEGARWSDAYADEALDVLEDLSGLRLARRLRSALGAWLALAVALVVALVRFVCAPRRERIYPFVELIHQAVGSITGLVTISTISLDADRAERVAEVLKPFAHLPRRDTGRGIYEFCTATSQIGREYPARAFASSELMLHRFSDAGWYRLLPADGRSMYVTGAHFARGAFAVFRASSGAALESADALEASGMKLYLMIASQLRFLYHMNRGEVALAKPHRARVEQHAAHVGSAWQVELWEDSALLPYYIAAGDVVEITRVVRRFDELVVLAPSLAFYRRLSELALIFVSDQLTDTAIQDALRLVEQRPARSFLGWTTVLSIIAAVHIEGGRYREARTLCERVLSLTTDDDREYVTLFLQVDLQTARADAGLGEVDAAFSRLDGLIARFLPSGHPLALGMLHDCRARVAHGAGREAAYEESLAACAHWYRGTGTPALIAKVEQLESLGRAEDTLGPRPVPLEVAQSSARAAEAIHSADTEVVSASKL